MNHGVSDRATVLSNFQCQGILLIRIIAGKGPPMLAVGAVGVHLYIFIAPIVGWLFWV